MAARLSTVTFRTYLPNPITMATCTRPPGAADSVTMTYSNPDTLTMTQQQHAPALPAAAPRLPAAGAAVSGISSSKSSSVVSSRSVPRLCARAAAGGAAADAPAACCAAGRGPAAVCA